MRVLCGISGIDFECDHFPGFLASRETCHPIFYMPQKKLLGYTGKFFTSELTSTDKYLLFLAVLHSSELVDFRLPAIQTPFTQSIIARNFESLVHIVCKINAVDAPSVVFPHIVVGPETRNLSNVHFWIDRWKESYKEFQSGTAKAYEGRKLIQRETALARLIKNPYKPSAEYASQIADWAISAGNIDSYKQLTNNPLTNTQTSLSSYWRTAIIRCAKLDRLYQIPESDMREILEHFETELDAIGSIYSHELLQILRTALKKRSDYLGLELGSNTANMKTYEEISSATPDDIQSSNMKLMIDLAPTIEPLKKDFPDTVSYLRAKMRWNMAKASGKFGPPPAPPTPISQLPPGLF
jgi:hypothetical protein